jgi:hypothetical protein
MLVGYDAHGLAAVIIGEDRDGPALVEANFGAVATRLRGQGGAYADEMVAVFMTSARDRAVDAGLSRFTVMGMIHERNLASKRMMTRAGFDFVRVVPRQPEYETWVAIIDIDA